jgi:hypothetical protein
MGDRSITKANRTMRVSRAVRVLLYEWSPEMLAVARTILVRGITRVVSLLLVQVLAA